MVQCVTMSIAETKKVWRCWPHNPLHVPWEPYVLAKSSNAKWVVFFRFVREWMCKSVQCWWAQPMQPLAYSPFCIRSFPSLITTLQWLGQSNKCRAMRKAAAQAKLMFPPKCRSKPRCEWCSWEDIVLLKANVTWRELLDTVQKLLLILVLVSRLGYFLVNARRSLCMFDNNKNTFKWGGFAIKMTTLFQK